MSMLLLFKKKSNVSQRSDIQTSESFEQVYYLRAEKVYSICRKQINNKEAAEEIVQDIFRSLWERRSTLKLQESLEHYLLRAAKLKVFDHFRQRREMKNT
ncbi:MAG: sigma factor [Bacteroidota bacterium]